MKILISTMLHFGHKIPKHVQWIADAPKKSNCFVRSLVQRDNRTASLRNVNGPYWTKFNSKNIEEATYGFNRFLRINYQAQPISCVVPSMISVTPTSQRKLTQQRTIFVKPLDNIHEYRFPQSIRYLKIGSIVLATAWPAEAAISMQLFSNKIREYLVLLLKKKLVIWRTLYIKEAIFQSEPILTNFDEANPRRYVISCAEYHSHETLVWSNELVPLSNSLDCGRFYEISAYARYEIYEITHTIRNWCDDS